MKIVMFQIRASAVFALGTLLDVGFDYCRENVGGDEECDDDEKLGAEIIIVKSLLSVASDGSPLVRTEVAVGKWSRMSLNLYYKFYLSKFFTCLSFFPIFKSSI